MVFSGIWVPPPKYNIKLTKYYFLYNCLHQKDYSDSTLPLDLMTKPLPDAHISSPQTFNYSSLHDLSYLLLRSSPSLIQYPTYNSSFFAPPFTSLPST